MKGKFISIEGPDGAGKTTQAKILVSMLQSFGYDVVFTREPGGSKRSELIRHMLLSGDADGPMHPTTEMLLFHAARADHVHNVIKPALEANKVVVCDRFSDSSYAYQGAARGRATDVEDLERFTLRGFEPDFTLFFDVTLEESLKRLLGRTEEQNAFDAETRDFKRAVYYGYKKRYHQNLHRMHLIDAMGTPEQVTEQVTTWLTHHLLPALREAGVPSQVAANR
jgi:dTMP kinase